MSLYGFTPKDWHDDPDPSTPILSTDLERIEAGVAAGVRGATEAQAGNVELASPSEMTTGTDLSRVPAVKRVVDFVNAQITAALSSIPSASAATETAAGVVELASATEMTTGTDLTRTPAVKRVADYVTAAVAASATSLTSTITALSDSLTIALATKADKSGSISQFADVDDAAASDTEVLRYDLGVSLWRPYDLSGQFALIGTDGRILPAEQPQFYVPLLVVNEGDPVPPSYPPNGIVLSRPLGGGGTSITPALIGQNKNSGGVTQVVVTLTDSVAVGDYLVFAVGTDASTTTGVVPTTHTFAYSSGVAPVSAGPSDFRSGTVQSNLYYARCTTAIPAGATVTMTANQTRGHLQLTVAKVIGLFANPATVVDRISNTNANNTAVNIALPTTLATAQASELAISTFAWNHAAAYPTPTRTLAPSSGWTQIGPINFTETATFRSSIMAFKILTAIGTIDTTGVFTTLDGSTGPWCGAMASFKGA